MNLGTIIMIVLGSIVYVAVIMILLTIPFMMFYKTVMNILHAIIDFSSPEYYCSSCGTRVKKDSFDCPKCKKVFVDMKEIDQDVK